MWATPISTRTYRDDLALAHMCIVASKYVLPGTEEHI